jgi:hypothetical protein
VPAWLPQVPSYLSLLAPTSTPASSSNSYASFHCLTFSSLGIFLASFFLLHRSAFALFRGFPESPFAMAHILIVVLSILPVLVIVVSAPVYFAETEYFDVVTDKIQDLESSLFELLGTNPMSVHFAEFALRYGKRYDSVRQFVHRFITFVKNAELI